MSNPASPKYTDPFRSMVEWFTSDNNWEDGAELAVLTPQDKVLIISCKSDLLHHFDRIAKEHPSLVGTTILASLPTGERTRVLSFCTYTEDKRWEKAPEEACKRILEEYDPLHGHCEDRWETGYWTETVADDSPFYCQYQAEEE
jgi:hypothetical protein